MKRHPARSAPPAVVAGPPLPPPPVATLGQALRRAADIGGERGVCLLAADGSEEHLSYPQLLAAGERVAAGIHAAGVPRGARIIVRTRAAVDLLTAVWGCLLGGYLPIPMTPPAPGEEPEQQARHLAAVRHTVGDAAFLAGDVPDVGEAFAGRWLGPVRTLHHPHPHPHAQTRPGSGVVEHAPGGEEVALLMLTAGSSGPPKAVQLTHRNILARAHASALVRGLDASTRSFNWMPLEHVGGLLMFHLRDVLLGCQQFHAPTAWVLRDPLRWPAALSRYGCDTTWAPNFAFGLVAERAEEAPHQRWDLSRLRYIMNGGEAVKAAVARRFLTALAPYGLPREAIHPGWGMSETAAGVIDCVFHPDTHPDAARFVPVGAPHPGVAVRVVDEEGRPHTEGRIGRLQISGVPVSPGYLDDPVANQRSFTLDGWFVTDDLAFVEDGQVTVVGRAGETILAQGTAWFGHEIEAAVEELECVEPTFTVACAMPRPGGGLALFFHPRPGTPPAQAREVVAAHLRERFGLEAAHLQAVTKEEVPKTLTGKLKRSSLAQRLAAG